MTAMPINPQLERVYRRDPDVFANRIVEELRALFGVEVAPSAGADCAATLAAMGEGLSTATAGKPVRELVDALTTHRPPDPHHLVHELAEILWLERAQRSEYQAKTTGMPPYLVTKLLLEYATRNRHLDALQDALTKDVCARVCDRLPVGCCSILGYDLDLVPPRMLKVQEIEARLNGWVPPDQEDKCKYHGPTGCVIALFKSPACNGYLCDLLMEHVQQQHRGPMLDALLAALVRYRNHDLDRSQIFEEMDAVIRAGRSLGVI